MLDYLNAERTECYHFSNLHLAMQRRERRTCANSSMNTQIRIEWRELRTVKSFIVKTSYTHYEEAQNCHHSAALSDHLAHEKAL